MKLVIRKVLYTLLTAALWCTILYYLFLSMTPTTTVYYSVSQDQIVRLTRHGEDQPVDSINNNEKYEVVYVK